MLGFVSGMNKFRKEKLPRKIGSGNLSGLVENQRLRTIKGFEYQGLRKEKVMKEGTILRKLFVENKEEEGGRA